MEISVYSQVRLKYNFYFQYFIKLLGINKQFKYFYDKLQQFII